MADDIRSLSAELARDPSSLLYVTLAELLRRRGHTQEALQAALHGLGRHPDHADGYDVLARVHADRGELEQARAAWERALAIAPEHAGALKGIGFLLWRQGDARRATEVLERALAADPKDEQARRAVAMVRGEAPPGSPPPPPPPPPSAGAEARAGRLTVDHVPQLRATAGIPAPTEVGEARAEAVPSREEPPVFMGLEGATADILLLDERGLVLAGGVRAGDGADVSELAAAALAGVSGEAERTAGYLGLGAWSAIIAEAEAAHVVLAPVEGGAMLMVRRDRSFPVGLAIRIAERARDAAGRWLEGQGL